ncbi:MAG: hypothetical protein KF790_11820 [Steroidobacteraceae bacterium]|nr:hypothetical protein [Steroidobacteraceae bacterium]
MAMAALVVASAPVIATTWAPDKVQDPVNKDRIDVQQPASSGSYIYQWPGKSDQVFWPFTDGAWLWFNPGSGYIAFGNDFKEIDPPRLEALRVWLKANYDRANAPRTRLELLLWAERVYSARGMSNDFWCHFYRLMAFETRSDEAVSLAYIRKAIPLLADRLNSESEAGPTMEALYLLGEYNRRLGNAADADRYLAQLTSFEASGEMSGFKAYLLEIAWEQRNPPADNPPEQTREQ